MRKLLPLLAVALVLAGCYAQEQDRMQESWDDPMKRLTPRQRTLVEMPAATITIDELVELRKELPGYAESKLRVRIREKVNWDDDLGNWDLTPLSPAEAMVWRLTWLDSEIGNGGLSQFFLNKSNWTVQIIRDLETLGCESVQDWFKKALSILPEDTNLSDSEQLASALDVANESDSVRAFWSELDEVYCQTLEGEFSDAIGRYFVKHHELFR